MSYFVVGIAIDASLTYMMGMLKGKGSDPADMFIMVIVCPL